MAYQFLSILSSFVKLAQNICSPFSKYAKLANLGFNKTRKNIQDEDTSKVVWPKKILIGYEGEYIYWILIPNNQVIRYSNVDWSSIFSTQKIINLATVKCCYIIENNFTSGLFDIYKELNNTNASEDILISIDFSSF